MSESPLRICDVCGQVDDHPRHRFVGAAAPVNHAHIEGVLGLDLTAEQKSYVIAGIVDTSLQERHMDCCREAGCPDDSCNRIAALGGEGLTGTDLHDLLTSGAVDAVGEQLNKERADA